MKLFKRKKLSHRMRLQRYMYNISFLMAVLYIAFISSNAINAFINQKYVWGSVHILLGVICCVTLYFLYRKALKKEKNRIIRVESSFEEFHNYGTSEVDKLSIDAKITLLEMIFSDIENPEAKCIMSLIEHYENSKL